MWKILLHPLRAWIPLSMHRLLDHKQNPPRIQREGHSYAARLTSWPDGVRPRVSKLRGFLDEEFEVQWGISYCCPRQYIGTYFRVRDWQSGHWGRACINTNVITMIYYNQKCCELLVMIQTALVGSISAKNLRDSSCVKFASKFLVIQRSVTIVTNYFANDASKTGFN